MKKKFTFRLDYFKSSGKWYGYGMIDIECECISLDESQPYIYDAMDYIVYMRTNNIIMPGLSGVWYDYITFQTEESYPTLILPYEGCR